MASTLYQAYRDNPELRQQLEERARELRSAEMDRLVFAPVAALIRNVFSRTAAATLPRRHSFHQA